MNQTIQFILISLCAATVIVSVLAVAMDAQKRNRSSVFVGLLCLITWPLGPILWLMRRPPPPLEWEK
jgi:hypothetical protein